jgi:prevent-host-death family protein
MNKIIGVTALVRNFRVVFDEVTNGKTPYVLTRGSRPEAVIIPYEEWMKHFRASDVDLKRQIAKLQADMIRLNARLSDDEIDRDLRTATREIRSRKRVRRHPNKVKA